MSASITSGTFPLAARQRARPIQHALAAAWQGLQRLGAGRARDQLQRLASQVQTADPALARALRDSARHLGEA